MDDLDAPFGDEMLATSACPTCGAIPGETHSDACRDARAIADALARGAELDEGFGVDDWTVGQSGRSNSSAQFLGLIRAVERIIRSSGHDLIQGRAGTVARVIVATLAHEHGLEPGPIPEDVALRRFDSLRRYPVLMRGNWAEPVGVMRLPHLEIDWAGAEIHQSYVMRVNSDGSARGELRALSIHPSLADG